MAVDSTAGGAEGREDGRHAEEVAVSHKPFPAETLARFAVTGSIEATREGIATFTALAGDAGERFWAGDCWGAGLGQAAASREGVAKGSLGAGAGGATIRNDALSIEATNDPVAHRRALALRVLLVANLATTPGCVVLWDTDGVLSTGQGGAGVDAG